MKTLISLPILPLAIALMTPLPTRAQTDVASDESAPYRITARGQDFATYTKITLTESADPNAWPELKTNQFTLLENSLHYRDETTGEWRESEDLIESFPDGAVARRGPHKAIFTRELNSQTVFDIQTADAKRIRGGVRAIQLTDTANARSITLATVKNTVTAQLLPPNTLLWADAFDGLKADLLINWKHNAWTHDVILKEQPELPLGWDAATTRLEILTEFFVDAEPELRQRNDAEDHPVIDFGAMAMLVGRAFTVEQTGAFNFSGDLRAEGVPVRKQWMRTGDNRRFLIESLDWRTAEQSLQNLPLRRHADNTSDKGKANPRIFPKTPPPLTDRKPIQLASSDYKATGYLIDFTIISGAATSTLTTGSTYYIQTSYYSGSTLTVQSGAIVKFKNNAYMLLYGPMTFPSSGAKAVFTSRNDDSIGDIIKTVAGESDSNGDPSAHRADPALWIYSDPNNITVRNTRFRWAKQGIYIQRNPTDTATQIISDCFFEHITGTGSGAITGDVTKTSGSTNLKKCKVDNNPSYPLALTLDCIGIENDWPGDSNWALTSPATAGWPANSSSNTPEIEGFAGATSVNAGSPINLYVDVRTSSDSAYTLQIYRMGWYGSVGARKMTWYDSGSASSVTSLSKTAVKQPFIAVDLSNGGVVDCLATTANGTTQTPWALSYTLNIPSWWLSGVYLVKLTATTTGKQSYIIFTIREDSRASDLYFQNSVTTWQAYNPWGGSSLYPYPATATRVSFNRPYSAGTRNSRHNLPPLSYGMGAGEFLTMINVDTEPAWEYNALRWIENQGYDVTYCTGVDTHSGALLSKSVKAFLSIGHDEYWSPEMRSNVVAARDRTTSPINLIFLAANECYWQIHFATGLRAFTCNKDLVWYPELNNGNGAYSYVDLWRDRHINNSEISLTGIQYFFNSVYGENITLTHPAGGHWVFNHTAILPGANSTLTGLLGYEVDGCWAGNANCNGVINDICPNWGAGTVQLADSTFPYVVTDPDDPEIITCSTTGHSYMTIYTAASGAQVFATGSMYWNFGLDDFGYVTHGFYPSRISGTARQITHNVVRKFSGQNTSSLP